MHSRTIFTLPLVLALTAAACGGSKAPEPQGQEQPKPSGGVAASAIDPATAADYAWDWRNYNPQQSFDRALNLLYDERARRSLRVWARVYDDGVFKPLFQRQAGPVDVEAIRRKLTELQSATEMMGVTLNQGLLRGELARFIERTKSAL